MLLQFIINKVQLLRTEARDLLERYLWELSEQQKYKDNYSVNGTSGGSLQISVGYLIDESVVEVSIIQAGNLPGNGKTHRSDGRATILAKDQRYLSIAASLLG